jgi:hypothetical protein
LHLTRFGRGKHNFRSLPEPAACGWLRWL